MKSILLALLLFLLVNKSYAQDDECTYGDGDFNATFYTDCKPDGEFPCTLSCFVNETIDYFCRKDIQYQKWIYYATDSLVNVTLFDDNGGCGGNYTEGYYCNYTLTNYYAGFYQCYFYFDNGNVGDVIIFHDFQIDNTTTGVGMGGSCSNDTECLALDATCSDSTCQCLDPNSIRAKDDEANPACLSEVDRGDPCNVNDQCYKPDEYYECTDNECKCSEKLIYVKNMKELMCIERVLPLGNCTYDENCGFYHSNTTTCDTDSGTCQCNPTATITNNLRMCVDSDLTITTSKCSADDIESDEGCSLGCTVNAASTNYTFSENIWTYSVKSGLAFNVTLFNSTHSEDEENKLYNTNISLTTFNAGYYVCHFVFFNETGGRVDMNAAFQIKPQQGKLIGESCTDNTDCSALNAECLQNGDGSSVCKCTEPNAIQYNLYDDAPACLPSVGEGGKCEITDQCTKPEEAYYCIDNLCTCTGEKYDVPDKGSMCLVPAPVTALCYHDQQCITPNTHCVNNECVCNDKYKLDDTQTICEKNLSSGAIAGIVIGSIAGVAIILSIIVYIVSHR